MLSNKELSQKYINYPKGYYTKFLIVDTMSGEILTTSILRDSAIDMAKSYKYNVAVIEIPSRNKKELTLNNK